MTAMGELEPAAARQRRGNAVELVQGAVLVLEALDEQHRCADREEERLDAPVAEVGIQPGLAPAPEDAVSVGVMAGKLLAKARRPVAARHRGDAFDRALLDMDMGRLEDEARDLPGMARGGDQSDGGAVAVAEQMGGAYPERRHDGGQQVGLPMKVVGPKAGGRRVGAPMTGTGPGDDLPARRSRKPPGEISPGREGAQGFMEQEHGPPPAGPAPIL